MAELTNINGETLGEDEYGAYGTLLQPESDFAIPEPLELIPPNPDPTPTKRNNTFQRRPRPFPRLPPTPEDNERV